LGCSGAGSSPESAVRALAKAAKAGDSAAVYARLAPRTKQTLAERAKLAHDQAAGRKEFKPEDMLSLGGAPKWEPARVRELERTGDRALVEVTGPEGQIQDVRAVRDHGEWFVELP
jgi:hypothetical protein